MQTLKYFIEKGIAKADCKSLQLFNEACSNFTDYKDIVPTKFIEAVWTNYLKLPKRNNTLNSTVFELIIIALLINKGIKPFYRQASVAFVPGIKYDILIYSKEGPITLSAKTSLRERFKQADLEAFVLKNVHRNAKSYLITLEKNEAATRIRNKNNLIGLENVYCCLNEDFNEFIASLISMKFIEPKPVKVITNGCVIK